MRACVCRPARGAVAARWTRFDHTFATAGQTCAVAVVKEAPKRHGKDEPMQCKCEPKEKTRQTPHSRADSEEPRDRQQQRPDATAEVCNKKPQEDAMSQSTSAERERLGKL